MTRLCDVFDGWGGYQTSLAHAIEPLSGKQLAWKSSEKLRSIGELATHIAMGRINWFLRMKAPGSEELAAKIEAWEHDPHGNGYIAEKAVGIDRDAAALVEWLAATWGMVERTLEAWSTEDLAVTYRHEWRGDVYDISRQWTVWRIMAHDIHHGGQIARVLAEQGIEAFELRGLGGHIVSPVKVGNTDLSKLPDFAMRYTAAWCSHDPASVAAFFSPDASFSVNNGTPAVGRSEITELAQSFMTTFPDLQVIMDQVRTRAAGVEYHWTLIGTNTGPGGSGHRVRISGFERWQLGTDGLIASSEGQFDAAEYRRQLEHGVQEPQ